MSSNPATRSDEWTIRRVLDWTRTYLAEHGSDSPRLDAEILLAHARKCPRIQLYTHFDDVLNEDVRARMRDLVKRRANREPVAYLVGYREFFSLDFEVNRDVLIPRPETETLVMETLEAIREAPLPQVLDVGTGSGCIAIALAVNAANASVTAVDCSAAALEVAARNANRHSVADRIRFLEGDLFPGGLSDAKFDVIVSNPPYVATGDPQLHPDVALHEPGGALFAGEDGLDTIRRIIKLSPLYLKDGGTLLIEFSPEQAEEITRLLHKNGAFNPVTIIPDANQQPRVVRARKQPENAPGQ